MIIASPVQARESGRYLVLLDEKQPFAWHENDILEKFKTGCVNSCALSGEARMSRDKSKPVVLESLGVGIFNFPREQLVEKYGADCVISDLSLSTPASVTVANGDSTDGGNCDFDETQQTWGRQVVDAPTGNPTGRGVKVCVVDTGLDTTHDDFSRFSSNQFAADQVRSFADDGTTRDSNGHGTHCTGIICGPTRPKSGARYGLAPDVDLFVANVFGRSPQTFTSNVVEAVEWAISKKCDIVSLSLQRTAVAANDAAMLADLADFEKLAKRALAANILLVACTGNASDRRDRKIVEASFPARCPSVLAVGAVNKCLKVLNTSNRGAEIFAPGFGIRSAAPGEEYVSMTGTSMAAAFVSGVAALHAEKDPALRGSNLLDKLRNGGGTSLRLPRGEPLAKMVAAP
jgi:subtilisin family serine protease